MKVTYDSEVDVLYVQFHRSAIHVSDEVQPGFIVDYDVGGGIVGFEVLHASHKVEDLPNVEVANMQVLTAA